MPARGPTATSPNHDWGWLRVPGSWCGSNRPPVFENVVQPGDGPQWQDFTGARTPALVAGASFRTTT